MVDHKFARHTLSLIIIQAKTVLKGVLEGSLWPPDYAPLLFGWMYRVAVASLLLYPDSNSKELRQTEDIIVEVLRRISQRWGVASLSRYSAF